MINNHVVSLDLAKQLYEAGIVVDNPQFVWRWSDDHPEGVVVSPVMGKVMSESIHTVPAPLASELMELMPSEWHDKVHNTFCQVQFRKIDGWTIDIHNGNMGFSGDELPNLCAKMLLYLKEKGLL